MNVNVLIAVLVLFSGSSALAQEKDEGKQKFLECLSVHNSTLKKVAGLSVDEKFRFAYTFLESYGSKKQASDFLSKKAEFISNPDTADSYIKLLSIKWTESCVSNISQ
ncbi:MULTISPECIES: hypothetical protein [unclassified Marinobacter]|jgi:hypothetical protein|uniref:hypothetical protein n=1 Tax=unclassified Marinobacter TaxID=83889 RepID=UPI000BF83E56|nr:MULTISPECIES: hypothetical protein [unclassified Marinobacter]PFG08827.1 hypothetical protein ATI45_1156 [Marinobacter sp. LV10MA510-1]PFG54693.1 hypothetical protein ATG98_3987 [Marinobacter sp. LV10R520-4]